VYPRIIAFVIILITFVLLRNIEVTHIKTWQLVHQFIPQTRISLYFILRCQSANRYIITHDRSLL